MQLTYGSAWFCRPLSHTQWLYDILGGFAHTGHNTPFDLYVVYMLPNSLWIIVPLVVTFVLGRQVLRALPGGSSKGSKST